MAKLDKGAVWPTVHTERRNLIEDLSDLSPDEWRAPSLCPGWDVHDVLAHLVDTAKTGRIDFVRRMIAARFDFDHDNAIGIVREKRADPEQTLHVMHSVAALTTTPPAPLATRLVEAFVHGEDIRRPLGIESAYPVKSVVAAIDYQAGVSVAMGGGKERAKGVRLVATDIDLAIGHGPEVRGRAIDLLLAVSGRPLPDGRLDGGGASRFATAAE